MLKYWAGATWIYTDIGKNIDMAKANKYKPFGKSKMAREPDEIKRCKARDGNGYELYKVYNGTKRKLPQEEVVKCKLDYPAKSIFGDYGIESNPDYNIELINHHLDKQDCNEYELRNLIFNYLKSKRKELDTNLFKSVCMIFDKADKMLGRSDKRKNPSHNEADVSYKFLIKSYKKIVNMCEKWIIDEAALKAVAEAARKASFKYEHRRGYGFSDKDIVAMEHFVDLILNKNAKYSEDLSAMNTRIYDGHTGNTYEIDILTFRRYIDSFYRKDFHRHHMQSLGRQFRTHNPHQGYAIINPIKHPFNPNNFKP